MATVYKTREEAVSAAILALEGGYADLFQEGQNEGVKGHDTTSVDCWCVPEVFHYPNGDVIVHRDPS